MIQSVCAIFKRHLQHKDNDRRKVEDGKSYATQAPALKRDMSQ